MRVMWSWLKLIEILTPSLFVRESFRLELEDSLDAWRNPLERRFFSQFYVKAWGSEIHPLPPLCRTDLSKRTIL